MKRLIALALVLCAGLDARAQDPSPTAWAYQNMLVGWQPGESIVPILDALSADVGAQNAATLDYVAEALSLHAGDPKLQLADASALVTTLARTKSGRYREVMLAASSLLAYGKPRAVARAYANEHKRKTVDPYVAGHLDFAALRAQLERLALAAQPTDVAAHRFGRLAAGSSLSDVFSLAGTPHRAEVRQVKLAVDTKFWRLMFYYRGTGRVVFSPDDERGWVLQSVVVDPLVFESEMPYRSRAAELGLPDEATLRMIQLSSGSILARKAAIESSMKTGDTVPLEFLDTAAQYCFENCLEPIDEIADDTNAWMVRLLVERGGPRYMRLIKSMNKSKGSRTYRQSIAPVRNVEGITRERFEPGSVSLAEKAAKYPSLYPEVTYWSGRL